MGVLMASLCLDVLPLGLNMILEVWTPRVAAHNLAGRSGAGKISEQLKEAYILSHYCHFIFYCENFKLGQKAERMV